MAKHTKPKVLVHQHFNRVFSAEFKRQKVQELSKGLLSITQLCKLHNVNRTAVYKWIYLYSSTEKGTKTVTQMESEQHKTMFLQQKVAELERIVGQKQLEIDYLNKAFEIVNKELGYDVKKS